jgi:hypothetical protein
MVCELIESLDMSGNHEAARRLCQELHNEIVQATGWPTDALLSDEDAAESDD